MIKKVLEKILNGSKSMVVRGVSGKKIPHSRVFAGENLFFIKKGTTKISAKATVKSVQNFVKLPEDDIVKTLADNEQNRRCSCWNKCAIQL